MSSSPRAGRPKATSRDTIAEAACELFLEQGYEQTSVVDVAQRAGVSRSSFFNYFESKSAILWAGLDERIAHAGDALAADPASGATAVRRALEALGSEFAPDSLALAFANSEAMGLDDELEREASVRAARLGRVIAARLRAEGMSAVRASVAGAAHGGAVLAAIESWAHAGAGHVSLADELRVALDAAAPTLR